MQKQLQYIGYFLATLGCIAATILFAMVQQQANQMRVLYQNQIVLEDRIDQSARVIVRQQAELGAVEFNQKVMAEYIANSQTNQLQIH